MFDKYYNGIIEQAKKRIGKLDRNIVMACYNNDFSIRDLDRVKRYSEEVDNVFFAYHEYENDRVVGAYEPFWDIICAMHHKSGTGTFEQFLKDCGVYDLHKELLLSYYQSGICRRRENVLLHEVAYEQKRMTDAMAAMLKALADIQPLLIVINRFQMASSSAMKLVQTLIEEPSSRIALVLGVNESQCRSNAGSECWQEIVEVLQDDSLIYHIGRSDRKMAARKVDQQGVTDSLESEADFSNYAILCQKLSNMVALLDVEQAISYMARIEHQIKFEDAKLAPDQKFDLYMLYIHAAILSEEISKALELVEEIQKIHLPGKEHILRYNCAYDTAICYMYQGKLEAALNYAHNAWTEADFLADEELVFRAELLMAQTQMSGWYNIFFCVQDVEIDDSLIGKLVKYGYKNHLAHIYIYAYDNNPRIVQEAYMGAAKLEYYNKGIALAQEIGNEQLVSNAYQKNIMIASTNGMNEIAMYYSVLTYRVLRDKNSLAGCRIYSGIGYNLSAMGYNKLAEQYYNRTIERLYELGLPEDIAEVHYNLALNDIMQEKFEEAEHHLLLSMKAIEKLHLNSLRVCNLSKLYALLSLSCALLKDKFNSERYQINCRQFLNYIIEKEKDNPNTEIVHDYAQCDDDMFLYTFATALLCRLDGDNATAYFNFEKAERFLMQAEGNQFFAYRLFRRSRMELYQDMHRTDLYEREKARLEEYEQIEASLCDKFKQDMLDGILWDNDTGACRVPDSDIESLIKQESVNRNYASSKRQMEFISAWQKQIDVSGIQIRDMVESAIRTFLNHYNNDCALYVRYENGEAEVLFNNTGVDMSPRVLKVLEHAMMEYSSGFAVSKIRADFTEYMNVIGPFCADEVCSMVAVPFLSNGALKSLLITYIRMKDNWHSSIERYMLDEDDLDIYRLLFRELNDSINRMEAYEKIYEMNQRLSEAAVTDMLTGIYNRAGMYQQITHRFGKDGVLHHGGVGIMFIDLDNFKHYNDTYGHDIGDLILQEMAHIFVAATEDKGFVCRYGGDEFIILLHTDDRTELEKIAQYIYQRIHESEGFRAAIEEKLGHPIEMDESRLITCSMGIAMQPQAEGEESINELIRQADDILYSVKIGKKGHYAFL